MEPGEELALERIVFFSDAVIAIAITLLVIDIRLPEITGPAAEELPRALLALWPRYLGFVVSFLVVGSYWFGHHRIFRAVRRYDDLLIWLNLVFLLCIAFIPFASSVLGEHLEERSAALFYALVIVATGLADTAVWLYVAHDRRLVDPDLSARSVRLGTLRALIPPAVFLVSLPLLLLHAYLAIAVWLASFPLLILFSRAERRAA